MSFAFPELCLVSLERGGRYVASSVARRSWRDEDGAVLWEDPDDLRLRLSLPVRVVVDSSLQLAWYDEHDGLWQMVPFSLVAFDRLFPGVSQGRSEVDLRREFMKPPVLS